MDKYRNQELAKKIFAALFVLFSLLMLGIAVSKEFTPAYDVMHELGTDLYIAPWTRILPYLIGVAAGWFLHTAEGVLPLQQVRV